MKRKTKPPLTRKELGLMQDFMGDYAEKEVLYKKAVKRKVSEGEELRLFCNFIRHKLGKRPILSFNFKMKSFRENLKHE